MKILSHSAPSPEDKPAEKKELRVETAPAVVGVSPAPQPDVESLSSRFEVELKKQIAVMHRGLMQDIEELHTHQQKFEEKEGRQVQSALEHIQKNYAAESKAAEQKWEADRAHWTDQLKQREAVIEKLRQEMSAMKQAAAAPPPVVPAPVPVQPLPQIAVAAPVAPAPITPVAASTLILQETKPWENLFERSPILPEDGAPTRRKPNLFGRVWEYLNGTAIEIPLKSRGKELS